MAQYTLRWLNRGTSDQDWNIQNTDNFTLQPDWERQSQIVIYYDYTYNIAVDTESRFAAATLTYTAATGAWTMASSTPNEWQLAVQGTLVTLTCFLSDNGGTQDEGVPSYSPADPHHA
jgi:hypothetical protein